MNNASVKSHSAINDLGSVSKFNTTNHKMNGNNNDNNNNNNSNNHDDDENFNSDLSNDDIEEFSSFDLSDDDNEINKTDNIQNTKYNDRIIIADDNNSNSITPNSNPTIMSTPRTTKISNETCNSENSNGISTKPSSRMSSDTFETPKTIDTRASTMTSNILFDCNKPLHPELLLPSATLINIKKSEKKENEPKIQKIKTPMKRLSRQNNNDISTGNDLDYKSSFTIRSLDNLFEKLSLDNKQIDGDSIFKTNSNSAVPNNELIELQNQLTNCKIQIKLQNDLLRDKIYQSIADAPNKQELSDEIQRKILNSINSSKMKFQLNQSNSEYNSLKQKYKDLIEKNNELTNSIGMLRNEVSDQRNNQHDWQNKINELVLKLKNSFSLESSIEINDFHDILNVLASYIDQLLKELLELRSNQNSYTLELNAKSKKTDELIEKIKQNEQQLLLLEENFSEKIEQTEQLNFDYKSKIFDYENEIKNHENNYSLLESKYKDLESKYDQIQMELNNKMKDKKEIEMNEKYKIELEELKKANANLTNENENKSYIVSKFVDNMKSYHSVVLDLLMKIIDPSSAGKMIEACKDLDKSSDYNEILKILSVAHNYEINSLTTILENYQLILNERDNNSFHNKTISELKGEILFLTQKIDDLENMKDSETVKIHELETQNFKLKEIANDKTNKIDQLRELRLNDLNRKWKAAEEALSYTRKGAQLKISELEEELKLLRIQLDQQRDM